MSPLQGLVRGRCVVSNLRARVKGIVAESQVRKMLTWFNSTYRGGVTEDQFRCLQPGNELRLKPAPDFSSQKLPPG